LRFRVTHEPPDIVRRRVLDGSNAVLEHLDPSFPYRRDARASPTSTRAVRQTGALGVLVGEFPNDSAAGILVSSK
jgi:hypothetical protein